MDTKKYIIRKRKIGLSYAKIGTLLNVSKQRIHQILKNYASPVTKEFGSGRDFIREKVRIRDKHICQDCNKKWTEGNRRFDCHHINDLCGKRSKYVDKIEEIGTMVTLCHKCHFNRPEHKSKKLSTV